MRKSLKIPLLIAGGLIAAVLLVSGGFLLGARDDLGSALRGVFPVAVGSSDPTDSYQLQQEVLDKLDSTYYKPVDNAQLHADAIAGMVAALNDPYTVYWDPTEYASFKQSTSGAYTGLGMTVEMVDRLVTIVSTFTGSPADRAGVVKGDIITSVEGQSVQGQTVDEVVTKIRTGAQGTAVTFQIYRPLVPVTTTTETSGASTGNGASTTTTTQVEQADLSQLPPGGQTKQFTLTRTTISIPVTQRETLEQGGKKVALIRFFTFSQGSAAALRAEVEKAVDEDKVDAIILDLRGNGGGLLNEGVDVASIFIPDGVIVSTEGQNSPKHTYSATGDAFPSIPLYVLTDPYTASASEIVAGALQDYKRATLVGETTFGKGLVQSIEPLSNGGALKATTAIYLTPKGRDINKKGIVPDVLAPDNSATPSVDETVEAALNLITGAATLPTTTSTTTSTAPVSTTVPSATP